MSEDKIVYAICQHRKIVFSCYDFNDRKLDNMKLETNEQGKLIQHKVSPYYLANDADEYYLIAHDPIQDVSEKPHLSHFEESKKMLEKLIEEAPFNSIKQDEALQRFSLDRYMRENIFMVHDDSPLIDLQLNFRESLQNTILKQFNLNRFKIRAFPTKKYFDDGERIFNTVITVQDNEGLYQWLMQNANDVIVVKPEFVRNKLKNRLQAALDFLN